MSIKPGSSVASGRSMVVSPAAAVTSLDGAIFAILSPSGLVCFQLPRADVQHTPRANHGPLHCRRLRVRYDRHPSQGGQNHRARHSHSTDLSDCSCMQHSILQNIHPGTSL